MNECPVAVVKPHWYPSWRATVLRVTATLIVVGVRTKEGRIVESRFRRKDGFPPGAFSNRHNLTPPWLLNHAEISAFADAHGGTWKRTEGKG